MRFIATVTVVCAASLAVASFDEHGSAIDEAIRASGAGSIGPRGAVTRDTVTQIPFSSRFRYCKPLIQNGEMSEWLKEHAWKSTLAARADAH